MENTKVVKFEEMTKAEKFSAICKVDGLTDEMRNFLTKEIENLKKKNSYKSKADLEKEKENADLENIIVDILTNYDEPIPTATIATIVGTKVEKYISTQKITPRCKALVNAGLIECVVEKGVNKYKAV